MFQKALDLLRDLIQTPSFSGEEAGTAQFIASWLEAEGFAHQRLGNNIWASNRHYDPDKPTILLNSHHDTVKPNAAYTRNPFEAKLEEGKLYGLGSNDAGGSLVALMSAFAYFYHRENLRYNLILAATAEEENSGERGLRMLLPELPPIDFAIVGEPTGMQLGIAEKGLLVIDALATGIPGHAAHENTDNPIYKALEDIQWIRTFAFPKVSEVLGPVKMSVTQIEAGTQHNVVPAECRFVIDVRFNEHYTNRVIFDVLDTHTKSQLTARSFKWHASSISKEHPIVQAGLRLGLPTFGSPTLSDQANLSCPSLKIGPGDTKRSHSADEFILLTELEDGMGWYIRLLDSIL